MFFFLYKKRGLKEMIPFSPPVSAQQDTGGTLDAPPAVEILIREAGK